MEDLILRLAYDVLAILIPMVVVLFFGWLVKRLGIETIRKAQEELAAKQQLVILAVEAVEQIWGGVLYGEDKVTKATEFISKLAGKAGLTFSSEEIRILIEWALRTLKDEFGEAWGKATTDPGLAT